RQRPGARPARLARRLAPRSCDRSIAVHPPRRATLGPPGVQPDRAARAPRGGRPHARCRRRRVRPAPDRDRGPLMERTAVLVVGGGPAGAATALGLARRGHDVILVERARAWHWRACGVFTSPATVARLRRLGGDGADPDPL